jgi:microsomal prostaglandin-E synthase 2
LEFVDTRFIRLTAPNLYRTYGDALSSFDYIAQNSQLATESAMQRAATKYVGATMMYLITKYKLNKKYNITDPRGMLYAACAEWMAAMPEGKSFRGGSEPNVVDVAAYGVLRALRGYKTFEDLQANTDPKFMQWFGEMDRRIAASAAPPKA